MHPKAARLPQTKDQPNNRIHLSSLVAMDNPSSVLAEVKNITLALDRGFDVKPIEKIS